ncbi:MAG: sensor histidine kinase [Desulfuromonadales bacterium]|nr:sensor histidine kinase [Desulfuromonadales bacterium]MBN2792329.1 sensor histidine kinase [Desulfuromonadales bacterium]
MKKKLQIFTPWWLIVIALVAAAGVVWQTARWTYDAALNELIETSHERLSLYVGTLRDALGQYAYVPYVLSRDSDVHILLKSSFNVGLVNTYLEELNQEAGSEALYIMNSVGDTLAASNWKQDISFVGKNYGFRPYFTDAKEGKRGSFFAIGVTTGNPGYFMSHPVIQDQRFLGAAVVKVDLAPLQEGWREGGETVMVSDSNGVLFLSSRDDWRYQTLAPLSDAQRAMILAGRQYGDRPLKPIALKIEGRNQAGQALVRYAGDSYLMISRPLEEMGWKIHHLSSLANVRGQARAVALTGTVFTLLILSLALYLRERRQKQLSRRQAREAEVMQKVNKRLKAEIAERTRTEQALRETQDELIQAGKLAALGHMAAGIVHELNQPIAAIKTQAASGRLLLDRGQPESVREILDAVSRMTEHMGSITRQLKSFAHKGPMKKERVVLQESLDGALAITRPLLDKHSVELKISVPESPLEIMALSGRMKQVFINLIRNAIDAMASSDVKLLSIAISKNAEDVMIKICDTGPGVSEQAQAELFTPFFTTKEVGEGLGLGLSISYRIITDLNGTIRVYNEDSGACFDIRLPVVDSEDR